MNKYAKYASSYKFTQAGAVRTTGSSTHAKHDYMPVILLACAICAAVITIIMLSI